MMLRYSQLKKSFTVLQHTRLLHLHEHQGKELLAKYGCSVQPFIVAKTKSEVTERIKQLGNVEYVVKAQILAGGRGKGKFLDGNKGLRGVLITKCQEEAINSSVAMIGNCLVTKQTTNKGIRVDKIMIAEGIPIKSERYFAVLMDRESNGPVIVVSPAGGMDIEAVAEKTPHLIHKHAIDIIKGLSDSQACTIAKDLGFEGELITKAAKEIKRLYKLFLAVDATQVEINPLVETEDGRIFCVDVKMNFDDSAYFRQKEIFDMEDLSEQDPREVEAGKHNLNYIPLDGNIACLVNGAGLAMATMDEIKLKGGEPANFLDVGGAVTEEQVYNAFRIICSDPKVKSILVNIFGGIVNCKTIAKGLIKACKEIDITIPLVVRLEGTNVEDAKKLMTASNLPIITANNLSEAAEKAVSVSTASA